MKAADPSHFFGGKSRQASGSDFQDWCARSRKECFKENLELRRRLGKVEAKVRTMMKVSEMSPGAKQELLVEFGFELTP